ncbi:MAG: hypothetical protein L0271_03190, partial [Gemmatimonadetes bacterium]|nr:hypothetical protein [Gemmatimonadota bacterium]
EAFTQKSEAEYKLPAVQFSAAAVECMLAYEWPGNIRELENCVAYLTCLQLRRPIEPRDLPLLSHLRHASATVDDEGRPDIEQPTRRGDSFQDSKSRLIAEFERQYIERALRTTSGNVSAAARMSGQNRRALFELMRKHEIRPDDYRTGQA